MKESNTYQLTTTPALAAIPCYRSALASARGAVGFNKNCEAGAFLFSL